MGTVLAIMGVYYVLNGQAVKTMSETAHWLREKLSNPEDNSKDEK